MGLNNPRFNIYPSPRLNGEIEKISQLQLNLVSEALKRAIDDMGAAMAHQLRDPLSSLVLYLHEIRQAAARGDVEETASPSILEIVDMALHEAERVCEILDRVGQTNCAPAHDEAAVARGSEAIESWTRRSAKGTGYLPPASLYGGQQSLTPREQEVLALITSGCSNKEGGHRLGISTRTFEAHRAHLMAKLGAKNLADLVRKALGEAHQEF
jgi:DNA-binding NarL/FixJ family response regulator